MTVAIEPKIIYPDRGVMGIEDTFLTTPSGAESITHIPRDIWQI
jgi:Xaa-Pro dipeptidase